MFNQAIDLKEDLDFWAAKAKIIEYLKSKHGVTDFESASLLDIVENWAYAIDMFCQQRNLSATKL